MKKAELITIGDEILIGQTIDTNSAWMGERLNMIGIAVEQISSIPDRRERIMEALDEAAERADLILITGGLGPTKDDVTKQTLCEYFETRLVLRVDVLKRIESYFEARGKEMLESNVLQAHLPESATVIENPFGTASGMWFEKGEKVFVSMPGVPYEMKSMMERTLLNMFREHYTQDTIDHYTIMTQGIGESFLAEKIVDWEQSIYDAGYSLAYLPSPGIVKLRISGIGKKDADSFLTQKAKEIEERFPQYVYGKQGEGLEEVLGHLLSTKGYTLSTAESCTGGFMAHRITSVPGSSQYYMGSVVAYDNRIKTGHLGVDPKLIRDHGAVSEEVVKAMALGVQEKFETDFSIATSGVAGPSGGSDEKPVGTVWIGIATPDHVFAEKFQFGQHRERTILKTTLTAMNLLRREVLNENNRL